MQFETIEEDWSPKAERHRAYAQWPFTFHSGCLKTLDAIFSLELRTIRVRYCTPVCPFVRHGFQISHYLPAATRHESRILHIALWKKISSPSGVVRKPKPFVELKNFTVPFSMFEASFITRDRGSDDKKRRPVINTDVA